MIEFVCGVKTSLVEDFAFGHDVAKAKILEGPGGPGFWRVFGGVRLGESEMISEQSRTFVLIDWHFAFSIGIYSELWD